MLVSHCSCDSTYTTNTHQYLPPSRTRIFPHLAPVSSSASHPCLPLPHTRVFLRLSLVIFLEITSARSVKMFLPEAWRRGKGVAEDIGARKWRMQTAASQHGRHEHIIYNKAAFRSHFSADDTFTFQSEGARNCNTQLSKRGICCHLANGESLFVFFIFFFWRKSGQNHSRWHFFSYLCTRKERMNARLGVRIAWTNKQRTVIINSINF